MKYLVTGANGFLGSHLLQSMKNKGLAVIGTVRTDDGQNFVTGDLSKFTAWADLFKDIDVVIHSAAKAHDMSGNSNLKKIYTEVNFNLTSQLAKQAKAYGVKRFIFISTIKVNGETTSKNHPFTAEDSPAPVDDYGISKFEAEQELLKMHQAGVFEIVIIRPCLVYGPGVKANFKSLMGLVEKNFPLPFGLIKNKRSLVSVDNLTDFILTCASHPKAGGEIFLISDDRDLSLPELIQALAKSMNKKAFLLPVPEFLFRLGLAAIGKKDLAMRLLSNLQVDISKAKRLLKWSPKFTIEQSLQNMQQRPSDGFSK